MRLIAAVLSTDRAVRNMTPERAIWRAVLRRYASAILVLVLAAAWGSSTGRSSVPRSPSTTGEPRVVSVPDVRAAMVRARTALIRGTATIADANTATTGTLTGIAQFTPPEEYDVIARAGRWT